MTSATTVADDSNTIPETRAPRWAVQSPADGLGPVAADFAPLLMRYKFAIEEVTTKVSILRDEFTFLHDHNPIEHVNSRLKSPASILAKADRKGIDPSPDGISDSMNDIAGVRIVCSFVSDVYAIFDALTGQADVRVLEVRDYIREPKANGYKSLHAIVEVPVFLSSGPVPVRVEIQIRTVAMDFWASLEHKIHYKFDQQVPDSVKADLGRAAATAADLDDLMSALHRQVRNAPAAAE